MGMTYEQFWQQDCSLVIAYRKAYKIRQEEKNREAWLQGLYMFKALQSTPIVVYGFAKAGEKTEPYPNKPYDFTPQKPKTAQERLDEEMREKSERIKRSMMDFMHAQQAENKKKEIEALLNDDKEGVTKDV